MTNDDLSFSLDVELNSGELDFDEIDRVREVLTKRWLRFAREAKERLESESRSEEPTGTGFTKSSESHFRIGHIRIGKPKEPEPDDPGDPAS